MVLHAKGKEKYFDPHLLKLLMEKNNDEAMSILQRHCENKMSPKLGQLKDSSEATLLHYAAEYGNANIAEYMLECKCKIDAQDNSGRTPLMLAVQEQREEVLEVLLKANANINLPDCRGKSALQMIFEPRPKRLSMIINLLHNTSGQEIIETITPDELAKKLVEAGCTAKIAVSWASAGFMKLLLRCEKTVGVFQPCIYSDMLRKTVQLGRADMLKVLIDDGADVDALDRDNATPLFYLWNDGMNTHNSSRDLEVLKVLMSRATSLTSSTDSGFMQMSNVLENGNEDAVEMILQMNVDLMATDGWGNCALHYLAKNGNIDHGKLLRGRKFNVKARNNDGFTPLLFAAEWDSFNALKFLLENGADVNEENDSGETPLYRLFARYGLSQERSAKILLQHGADPQVFMANVNGLYACTILDLIAIRADAFAFSAFDVGENLLSRAEPVLARLAIVEGLGTKVTQLTRSRIQAIESWAEYFDTCQKRVGQMKRTTVYNSVTLFQFLTGSRKKMAAYVRNEELVAELEKALEEFEVNSPYTELLRSRLDEAIKVANLREKSDIAIRRLVNANYSVDYFPAEYIVDYLSIPDMANLSLV